MNATPLHAPRRSVNQGSLPSRPGSQVQPGSPVESWLNRMLENWPQLVCVAMRTLGCRYLAEDAVQQSLLKICEMDSSRTLKIRRAIFFAWCATWPSTMRAAATEPGHAAPAARLQNVASACACPQSRLEHCEALKIIQSALSELPVRTRRVFELHRLHSIPQKEIVLRIGVSPTLVNFMVRDAHQHCREQLRHYEHGTAQSLVKHPARKFDGYARASGRCRGQSGIGFRRLTLESGHLRGEDASASRPASPVAKIWLKSGPFEPHSRGKIGSGNDFASPHHFVAFMQGTTSWSSRLLKPVLIDARSGEVVAKRELPWYVSALLVSQPLHFGDYGGMPLKILWALLDVIAIVVLGSGLYLWLARGRRPVEQRIAELERDAAGTPVTAS